MGKKKRTNNKQNSSSTTMKNIDEKVLAREIIQAYEEFEQKKKFEVEKRERENQKEWNQILGQKEYPENENWFWKNVHKKRNDIVALYKLLFATVYKGNIIKNLIMDCQSYTKYRPNETTGGIFVSWRRKEELPTGA